MANLAFKYAAPSGALEYFEIKNRGPLLIAWQKACGSTWANVTQIVGIPPGVDWHVVEWDSKAACIVYKARQASNPNLPPLPIALGPKYMNHDTGEAEDRTPAPPPRRDYLFTSRSPKGTLVERTRTGANLVDIVQTEQDMLPDHVIISITYKGDA